MDKAEVVFEKLAESIRIDDDSYHKSLPYMEKKLTREGHGPKAWEYGAALAPILAGTLGGAHLAERAVSSLPAKLMAIGVGGLGGATGSWLLTKKLHDNFIKPKKRKKFEDLGFKYDEGGNVTHVPEKYLRSKYRNK